VGVFPAPSALFSGVVSVREIGRRRSLLRTETEVFSVLADVATAASGLLWTVGPLTRCWIIPRITVASPADWNLARHDRDHHRPSPSQLARPESIGSAGCGGFDQ